MAESVQRVGETIENRRRQEEADVDLEPMGDDVGAAPSSRSELGGEFDDPADRYAGDERSGRLVAPDEGVHEDVDPEAVAHEMP